MLELDESFPLLTHFQQHIPFPEEALHKHNSAITTQLFDAKSMNIPITQK